VVVVNGLGLEGWLDRLVKASGFKGSWWWPQQA
jgi:zinc/manganese transport system substrate-binding protein